VSLKLLPSILIASVLFILPAFAQPGAAPPAAPAADKADVLSPEQAKRALETLSDDKKRAGHRDVARDRQCLAASRGA